MPHSPAQQGRLLQRRIALLAAERGTTEARLRRLVGFSVLCETLAEAAARGVIPVFFVKGGVAIELRLGLAARATKDLDIGLCASPEDLLGFFDRAMAVAFGDFRLRRRGVPRVLDNGVRQLEVTIEYVGRPFSTVEVDLAPATSETELDAVAPVALSDLGLAQPRPVVCLSVTEQIAQKIHALTEPTPRGRPNARARDVLDVLLLNARLELDLAAIRRACVRVFTQRAVHRWPVQGFTFPQQWLTTLPDLARQTSYDTDDVAVIAMRFDALLARINGVSFFSEALVGLPRRYSARRARPTAFASHGANSAAFSADAPALSRSGVRKEASRPPGDRRAVALRLAPPGR